GLTNAPQTWRSSVARVATDGHGKHGPSMAGTRHTSRCPTHKSSDGPNQLLLHPCVRRVGPARVRRRHGDLQAFLAMGPSLRQSGVLLGGRKRPSEGEVRGGGGGDQVRSRFGEVGRGPGPATSTGTAVMLCSQ